MCIVNVEAAIFHEGKWLMIERSLKEAHAGGDISLVGGKAELSGHATSVLEATIKREVMEEVGVTIRDEMKYVQSSSFVTGDGVPVIDVVFLCEYVEGIAASQSPDEVEAVFWMTYDEIMNHPKVQPWTRESIENAEQLRRA